MILWLRRRLIFWVAVVVGLPLLARLLHGAADMIEGRSGPGAAAARLHLAGRGAERLQGTLRRGDGRRR